jgi:hypothetical protein
MLGLGKGSHGHDSMVTAELFLRTSRRVIERIPQHAAIGLRI